MSSSQYGLSSGGSILTGRSMSQMIRRAAEGAGIHSIINRGLYSTNHQIVDNPCPSYIRESLRDASNKARFDLTYI